MVCKKPEALFKQRGWFNNLSRRFSCVCNSFMYTLNGSCLVSATDLVFDYQSIKLLSRAVCSLKLDAQYGHWQMLLINYFNTTLLSGRESSQNENKMTANPTPSFFHTVAINSQCQIFHLALQL